ncbi:MAG: hypothetical protein H0U49_12840 [Parachlamydiaceae bacterium]|nr:hypothetical protein [Parachlamydiaceae bacterium]
MNDLPELNENAQNDALDATAQGITVNANEQESDLNELVQSEAEISEEESSAEYEAHQQHSEPGEEESLTSHDNVEDKSSTADVHADIHHAKDKNYKQRYETFVASLNAIENPEEKLVLVVDFMEATLSAHQATPHFKSFWDARAIALTLFKENIAPVERVKLWDRYTALSKESRRLKSLFDEQGAFASEQIEIAVTALEKELDNPEEALSKMPEANFLENCSTLIPKKDDYYLTQSHLNLLNAQAGRITALRKELIHTEMRVRQKNKFFQRLSSAGDKVFPKRKELINHLSQQFGEDIQAFIDRYFAQESPHDSPFFLREEIKALQGVAKELTLNTQSFTRTRMALSECWDKLKLFEKERKKVRSEQKELFKNNYNIVLEQIQALGKEIESGEISDSEISDKFDEIANELRRLALGRDELKALREEVSALQKPFYDKLKSIEQERLFQIKEKDRLKKFKGVELRNAIEAFMLDLDSYDVDSMIAKRDEFQQKIADLPMIKSEKQDLERLLKPVKDAIVDKKEQTLMALSDDDRQALQQLHEILKQRLAQRAEIKSQLELIRKSRGASSLSFEQAMSYNAQEAQEKERLERVSHGIEEIKGKIATLEEIKG